MRDSVRESAMTLTCHICKKPGHKMKDCKQLMEIRIGRVMWKTTQGNGAHAIIIMATRTRTAISSNGRKKCSSITRAEATLMASAITKEMMAVILPLTVKL